MYKHVRYPVYNLEEESSGDSMAPGFCLSIPWLIPPKAEGRRIGEHVWASQNTLRPNLSDCRIMIIFWSVWNLLWCSITTFFFHMSSESIVYFWYLLFCYSCDHDSNYISDSVCESLSQLLFLMDRVMGSPLFLVNIFLCGFAKCIGFSYGQYFFFSW